MRDVRTVEYGAKLNLPPMAAFRAPGFVEGTWSLECLLDKIAAELDIDPLELRRRNYANADTMDGRPYSSKNLMECYRRAEPSWERRVEVRARSDETWKRGVGLAGQIWYGGGVPPSYAWVRVGSDGRVNVVTAMQDIGTGTRTAMAQIAAEELGLPLERVEVQVGDSARGPFAVISGGSSTLPSMGPAVRAAAADAARQILEIAAQRFDLEQRVLSLRGGNIVSADGGSWPLEEITGLLQDGQILGKGARGPNPAGMRVLTFGVQVAEVAVDVETGEVVVERIHAVHDVGRVINPLGARSQIEGGIIQAMGHTFSEVRLDDPRTGSILTRTLDAYKLPTFADVPEIVCELVDEPDEHLTNLGSKVSASRRSSRPQLRSRTRSATRPAPTSRRCRSRGRRSSRPFVKHENASALQLVRPSSLEEFAALGREPGDHALAGGTELVPQLRDGLVHAERLVQISDVVPRGVEGRRSARARRSQSSSTTPASRRPCVRPVVSQPRRSSATWGRSAATCCSRRAAGTGDCSFRAACTAATSATRAPDSTASTRSSRTTSAPRRIPRTLRRRCSRSAHASAPTVASSRSTSSIGSRRRTTGA